MKYEIDFLGITEKTCDADAISFRFFDERLERYVVGVYDGGTKIYGEALTEHLKKYYFVNTSNPVIDFVICSHPDQDHSSGLSIILENFKVNALYVNIPWLYVDDIFDNVNDGRITKESLIKRMKEAYQYIAELETIANRKGIEIYESFQGSKVWHNITILSPSKEFYLKLLVESNKTPLVSNSVCGNRLFDKALKYAKAIYESWTKELLREEVKTSAENESSIVIYGDMQTESLLLVGDAGIRSLRDVINYAQQNCYDLSKIKVYQIPHHGGRHNVSPSILNDLIGNVVANGATINKVAFVSVGIDSDHPRKMVTNAYIRRGVNVFVVRGQIQNHRVGLPNREGWISAVPSQFNDNVEEWND